ncbi:HAD family hydrolase [Flavobacterium aurantiibacter]|uniref:HAD family hydrolase n=1 Tax=Flavobacterium aurantiibacter TaxID=2023067 RepID=A0A255ZQ01_9FLAO|nr:HAD family hydrolase [Flavobacterium aurantiibacter]OYQ43657.1 HAD family hydrolase [Flavobacterium aurantiibacter]
MKIPSNIKVIAFDADDTLWVNEPYFQEVETHFCELMAPYLSRHQLSAELFKTEIDNLKYYGYGIKGYILSMIEAALLISNNTISNEVTARILALGKELIEKPIEILDGVPDVLKSFSGRYKLVVATKGDLLDQHRKLHKSGLGHYFHHIEVMSDKQASDYRKLLNRLEISADDFLMIGNSLKSDVLPVLEVGGYAVHIPFHTTWAHEKIDHQVVHERFTTCENIHEVTALFSDETTN